MGHGYRFALDADDNFVFEGDYVKAIKSCYMGMNKGDRRRVIRVDGNTNIVLRNDYSPRGESFYNARNFRLAAKHHRWHKQQENKMTNAVIYVAVRLDYNSYNDVVDCINHTQSSVYFQADILYESLKRWLRQRIAENPQEKWLILSGTTLAEMEATPIRFRPA